VIDQATIDAVKAAQPDDADLELVTAGDGVHQAIIRAATEAEMAEWRAANFDEKRRAKAMSRLVRSCVLFPKAADFGAQLAKKPALIEEYSKKVLALTGFTDEAESVKL